ncbi:MAG TPA: hypothetical protein VEF89_34360 [Solirubrobacteraceae bacterium]|nr:hypothetical protein [Solirubrobacteraceae bacterium]
MEPGKRKLVLALDPDAPQNGHVRGPNLGVAEQRGLADARFAMQYERRAAPITGGLKELAQDAPLSVAPHQHARIVKQTVV